MQTLFSCIIKCSAEAEQIKDKLSTFYFYSLVQCKQQTARHQGRNEVLLWATWTQWHPVVWLVGIIKQEHKCLVSSFHFLINKFVFTRKTTWVDKVAKFTLFPNPKDLWITSSLCLYNHCGNAFILQQIRSGTDHLSFILYKGIVVAYIIRWCTF